MAMYVTVWSAFIFVSTLFICKLLSNTLIVSKDMTNIYQSAQIYIIKTFHYQNHHSNIKVI